MVRCGFRRRQGTAAFPVGPVRPVSYPLLEPARMNVPLGVFYAAQR